MSLYRRKLQYIKVDTNEELSKKAFNAAESGVDNYLGTGSTVYKSEDAQTAADVSTVNVGNGTTVNFNQFILANQSSFYWLVGHDKNADIDYTTYYVGTSLSICVQSAFTGALKIDYFYRDSSNNYITKRFGYNLTADVVPGFDNLPPTAQGKCVAKYQEIDISGAVLDGGTTVKPLLLSIKPVGSGTRMYLTGTGQLFPVQGEVISSKGKTEGVSRQVGVLRVYDVSPFLVDSVIGWGNILSN